MRERAAQGFWSRALGHLSIPCPRFIGRQDELLWLQERLEAARRGQGEVVLLAGEAGIGKSRLVSEVTLRALQAEVLVLEGKCPLFEPLLPYAPFVEAFRGLLRARTPAQIAAVFGAHASEVMKLLPELAQLMPGVAPNPPLNPAEEKGRLFESLYLVFRQIAADAPLILTLEDIHWADPASLELTHFLARRLRRDRWLILGTYRPEELSRAEDLTRLRQELTRERLAQELPVKPLNAAETGELLNQVLGAQASAPEGFAAWIFQFGEGHPFFTEEILRSIVEESDDVHLSLDTTSVSRVAVPPTVRETILARVSHLTPEARGVLGAAAVLGRTFELEALSHVGQLTGEAFSQSFMSLLSAQLVRADRTPLRYTFRHSLIREVMLQYQAPDVRRKLHRRAGEFLESRASATPQALAHHFREAGDQGKTIQYALAAAAQASAVYAHEEAALLFDLALETLPAGATEIRLAAAEGHGDALFNSRTLNRAIGAFTAMRECARELEMPREEARACRKLGQVHEALVQGSGFESWENGLAILAQVDDPSEEAMIRQMTAAARYRMGQYERGLIEAQAAVAAATRSEHPGALSLAYVSLAANLGALGRHDEVAAFAQQALMFARQAGDREAEIRALNMTGVNAYEDAAFARSRQALESGSELAKKIGSARWSAVLSGSLSELSFMDGRWDEAEATATRALTQILDRSEHHWPFMSVAASLAAVLVCQGRFEEAESLLSVTRHTSSTGYPVVLARNALADLELKRGNASASKPILEEAWKIIEATGYGGSGKAETLLLLAETCLQLDDLAAARSWLNKAARAVNGYRRLAPAILRVQSKVAAHEGELTAAVALCLMGLDHPAATAEPYQEALLRFNLGVCLLRRSQPGDRRAARAHLASALAAFQRLGATPDADMARQANQRIGGRVPSGRMLTEREREVLGLLSQGFSNAAIAAQLYISERTAETHVSNILNKLGVETRTQAVAWAAQNRVGLES